MTKPLQTGLLLTTALAGYMSARCPVINWKTLLGLSGSMFLAISGTTMLNMWYDRDIDRTMGRTENRPIPSGRVKPREAFVLGLFMIVFGSSWAFALSPLYGGIVFAGSFFDIFIYTIWLKRRTCWSIFWGGISGGMPVLAGRALGIGALDWIGIALSLAVLLWIPIHIMTFNIRFAKDYQRASVPTVPARYGLPFTRRIIAASSVLLAGAMVISAYGIGMAWGFLRLFAVLTGGLLILAIVSTIRPSENVNYGLFKYASLYMLGAMLLVLLTGF